MELFRKNKLKEDFHKTLEKLKYNSQANNICLFYVINKDQTGNIYLIYDPFDFWEKECLIEEYEGSFNYKVLELNTVERIN